MAAAVLFLCLISFVLSPSGHAGQSEPSKNLTASPLQPTDKSCFIEGLSAYQRKEYGKAAQKLKLLLKLYPGSPLRPLSHYMLAQTYYHSGNLNEASRHMQIILKEYPDFALKGILNPHQQELLKNGETVALSKPPEDTDSAQSIPEGPDSPSHDAADGTEPDDAAATALQNLDEIRIAYPGATFNELILLRITQLYLSAGNLPEASYYYNKLASEFPVFPLNSFFNRQQRALLTRDYSVPVGKIVNLMPRELPVPPAPSAVNEQKAEHAPGAAPAAALTVSNVIVDDGSIEIVVAGRINDYKSFLLHQPERLVIDIPGAESKMKIKSISVNRYGIAKVRIGFHPKSVRIVCEAAVARFPPYKILPTDRGIKIVLQESLPQ